MNTPSQAFSRPVLEVRGARASSVIVQRVPEPLAKVFLEWQNGIAQAAAAFAGYQTTEVYPPSGTLEWVVVIHFDDAATLQAWLDSAKRAEWMENLPAELREFRLKTLPTGFGSWFVQPVENPQPLPHWKMFLIVLFGLYPTVMLLQFFLGPHIQHLGLAVSMLIGNAASVSFLEWIGMPFIGRFAGRWLHSNDEKSRVQSVVGMIILVLALALMTFGFGLVPGKM